MTFLRIAFLFACIISGVAILANRRKNAEIAEREERGETVTICDVEFDGSDIVSYKCELEESVQPQEYIIAKRESGFLLGGLVVSVHEVKITRENFKDLEKLETIWAKLTDHSTKEAMKYNKRYARKHSSDGIDWIDEFEAYDALFN